MGSAAVGQMALAIIGRKIDQHMCSCVELLKMEHGERQVSRECGEQQWLEAHLLRAIDATRNSWEQMSMNGQMNQLTLSALDYASLGLGQQMYWLLAAPVLL